MTNRRDFLSAILPVGLGVVAVPVLADNTRIWTLPEVEKCPPVEMRAKVGYSDKKDASKCFTRVNREQIAVVFYLRETAVPLHLLTGEGHSSEAAEQDVQIQIDNLCAGILIHSLENGARTEKRANFLYQDLSSLEFGVCGDTTRHYVKYWVAAISLNLNCPLDLVIASNFGVTGPIDFAWPENATVELS